MSQPIRHLSAALGKQVGAATWPARRPFRSNGAQKRKERSREDSAGSTDEVRKANEANPRGIGGGIVSSIRYWGEPRLVKNGVSRAGLAQHCRSCRLG
jgi:hypothetical protein